MTVRKIIRSGLAEARRSGAKQVELRHLADDDVDELASETLAFLRSRPGRPSAVSGWTAVAASKAGVIPFWATQARLTTESQRRSLRALRHQVYDLLDERGLILKPARATAAVDVSPAAVATSEAAEPAAVATSEGEAAWVLRVDPGVWDLGRFVADGNGVVSAWAVEDNERSATMGRGQRVFLWAGGDDTAIMAGVWGVGWVVGPCQWRSVADGYWIDPTGNSRLGLFADVSIQLLRHPVGRQQVIDNPGLAAIEVLRDPFGSNPSSLTPAEDVAMVAMVGFDPPPPV